MMNWYFEPKFCSLISVTYNRQKKKKKTLKKFALLHFIQILSKNSVHVRVWWQLSRARLSEREQLVDPVFDWLDKVECGRGGEELAEIKTRIELFVLVRLQIHVEQVQTLDKLGLG